MGQIVVDRVPNAGHDVVAFDIDEDAIATAVERGATGAPSISDLANQPGDEKCIWLMVSAGDSVDTALDELEPSLARDDIVVDGGNSNFQDSIRRAESTVAADLDCGTNSGPAGAELRFSLMIGGPQWAFEELTPIFDAIAIGPDGHEWFGPLGDMISSIRARRTDRTRFLLSLYDMLVPSNLEVTFSLNR